MASFVQGPYIRDNVEYTRHREKLEEEFFFDQFSPLKHYSLQFLFETLPRHVNAMVDEAITPVRSLRERGGAATAGPVRRSGLGFVTVHVAHDVLCAKRSVSWRRRCRPPLRQSTPRRPS